MGNSPSTSKPATPTQRHLVEHAERVDRGHESPRANKSEPKHLISAHQHQHRSSASSPEASVVSAQGSTIGPRAANSRPLSILNPAPASSSSPSSRSSVSKPRYPEDHDAPTKPVDVPVSSNSQHNNPDDTSSARSSPQFGDDPLLTSVPTSASVTDMSYNLPRPPRLPLPIEEEIHTPGSPIIAPAVGESIEALEGNLEREAEKEAADLTRKSSGLSNTTDDEDAEELRVDKSRTMPTRIEWLQGGQKVYVTGTPFQWSRKQRLHPAKGREGVLEAIIPVFPGTHHIKFLVDGRMETSMHLPTTVDFGNNLVNYIEVSGDDAAAARNLAVGTGAPKSANEAQALPSRQPSDSRLEGEDKQPAKKEIPPPEEFSHAIPQYLADFDQPEDTRPYQLSVGALDKLPTPPALPGFLSKPIMNANALIKDDNSVLNMPNHTVLNHLATSSIKNNVLAVSATTRYKNKYVTTIVYKPTSEDM